MPNVLSKLKDAILMPEWSIAFNCYEIGHTWDPSCSMAAWELTSIVLKEGFLMYTGLYTLSLFAFTRKVDKGKIWETVKNIVISTSFLFFNGYAMFRLFCFITKYTGKLYYSLTAGIPAFLSSLIAIHIERHSRRLQLAIYCANIASECLYKIGVRKNYWKAIPYGETIIFSTSIAIILYIFRKHGIGKDPISYALSFILGRHEAKRRQRPVLSVAKSSNEKSNEKDDIENNNVIVTKWPNLNHFLNVKHACCPHSKLSCVQYVLKGFLQPFGMAYIGQSLLASLMRPKRFLNNPFILLRALRNRRTVNFALFIGAFSGLFRSINCALRWKRNKNEDWHAFVAGLISGSTMLLSRNTTITSYILWKCIESIFSLGVEKNMIPYPNAIVALLYAVSVDIIFYTGILEPGCLRPSYFVFVDRVTKHRLHLMNRNLLSIFGTDAHIGYEDYFPDLKPELCTKMFLSTVFVWMI